MGTLDLHNDKKICPDAATSNEVLKMGLMGIFSTKATVAHQIP
jgi:hypothetical protein